MKVFQIRTYKGKDLSYDKQGNCKNETSLLKLVGDMAFDKFLKYLGAQGYCSVELKRVIDNDKDVSKEELEAYALKLNKSFGGNVEEQEKPVSLESLMARLEKLEEENKALKSDVNDDKPLEEMTKNELMVYAKDKEYEFNAQDSKQVILDLIIAIESGE